MRLFRREKPEEMKKKYNLTLDEIVLLHLKMGVDLGRFREKAGELRIEGKDIDSAVNVVMEKAIKPLIAEHDALMERLHECYGSLITDIKGYRGFFKAECERLVNENRKLTERWLNIYRSLIEEIKSFTKEEISKQQTG